MAINNYLKIITRVENVIEELKHTYHHQPLTLLELKKLQQSLAQVRHYLENLDQLKPDYNTNEIAHYLEAIEVHLAILKEELKSSDYTRLSNGMRILKMALRFHPTRYSYLTFIIAWLYEMLYFI